MGFIIWLKESWFQALQTLSIISSLLFTAYTVRVDGRARKVENLLSITASHREIWSSIFDRPELQRVLSVNTDLKHEDITDSEELFVHLVFLHASAVYEAIQESLLPKPHSLEDDLARFLALPIPCKVWKSMKMFYEPSFVNFVESCTHPPYENDF